jgi:hypothetical protein
MPTDPAHRDDAWFAHHTSRLPPEAVLRIAAEVGDSVGFICGTVGNETVDADNLRFGAHLIDANPPVTEVVDQLLAHLDLTM